MTIKENGVPSENELTYEQLNLRIDGVSLKVATVRRGGDLAPLVFLHGFRRVITKGHCLLPASSGLIVQRAGGGVEAAVSDRTRGGGNAPMGKTWAWPRRRTSLTRP